MSRKRRSERFDSLYADRTAGVAWQVRRLMIEVAVLAAEGNLGQAARALGIDRKVLSKRADECGFTAEEWRALQEQGRALHVPDGRTTRHQAPSRKTTAGRPRAAARRSSQ